MMAITHGAIASAGVSLLLITGDPLVLGLAVAGSQLPDLDTTTSTIGKILFPIASWIEDRYPHRTITHSLLATATIALLSWVCCILLGVSDWRVIAAVPLGHLLACFSDCFTVKGVQLFYPNPAWCISVSNPKRRLKTGGTGEYWVLAMAIALLVVGIWFSKGGGISSQLGRGLGLQDAVISQYNASAGTNIIYANIKGIKNSDRSPIEGRFPIITLIGNNFLIKDGENLYTLNKDITTNKVNLEVGENQTTELLTLKFDEEYIIDKLNAVANAFPTAQVYLEGNLTIDLPEDIDIVNNPGTTPTITITGNTAKLNYCTLSSAIAYLNEQYGTGNLLIRVITSN